MLCFAFLQLPTYFNIYMCGWYGVYSSDLLTFCSCSSRGQHPEAAGVQERRPRGSGLRQEAETEGETVPGGRGTMKTNTQTTASSKNIQFVLMICTKKQKTTKSTQKETLVLDELQSMTLPRPSQWSWTRSHLHLNLTFTCRLLPDVCSNQCKR